MAGAVAAMQRLHLYRGRPLHRSTRRGRQRPGNNRELGLGLGRRPRPHSAPVQRQTPAMAPARRRARVGQAAGLVSQAQVGVQVQAADQADPESHLLHADWAARAPCPRRRSCWTRLPTTWPASTMHAAQLGQGLEVPVELQQQHGSRPSRRLDRDSWPLPTIQQASAALSVCAGRELVFDARPLRFHERTVPVLLLSLSLS